MKKIYQSILAVCLIISSCKNGGDDPLAAVDLYGPDLPGTLTAYNGLKTGLNHQRKPDAPAMYVDFSAGMYTAFGTPVIKELMSQCFNTVLARKFAVFGLAEGQVTPLLVGNSTELGQIVNDPKKYLDVRAPIQAAVEKIVAAKNDALLITDFEEWQNDAEVTGTAYLKIPFSKWLNDGNSISFFIADYKEGKVDKHVYFTVFTYGRPVGNSLIDKLRTKLATLPKFDLATDAYLMSTDYPDAKTGGIFRDANGKDEQRQNVLDLRPEYFNGLEQHRSFEYYPLGLNWATIDETRKEYAGEGLFHDLFRKLFIDLSNTDSYHYDKLEVKTYDITADFEKYARSREVKKHKPAIVKGADGEDKISDKETDLIALKCYNSDGSVKLEFRYEAAEPRELNDAFTLNQTLLTNTEHTEPKKAEIGIGFAPQFGPDKVSGSLIKLALTVRETSVNNDNPVLEKFKWINKNGIANTGLYGSVKNTLEEMRPKDKIIYTYYIKTTE